MTGSYDTIDVLMARYVAGTLPLPAHVLVAAHLDIRAENRSFVAGLEDMAGTRLDGLSPVEISDRDARLAAIFDSPASSDAPRIVRKPSIMPAVLQDFIGFDVEEMPWRTKMPGFREFDIGEVDGCHVSMFWIKPGRKIPAHTHEGSELSLVLDGAFNDVTGRFARGDIAVADDAVDHRPTAENERPCIGFAVTDAPLRFTGPLHQRLTDILGF
jgi:putative transcriptional regulator